MSEREYFLWKTWSQAGSLLLTGEHHLDRLFWSCFFFIACNYQTVANGDDWLLQIVTDFPPAFYWPLLTITYITCYWCLSLIITDYDYRCWFYSSLWSEYYLIFIATKYPWWSKFTSGTGRDAESFSSPPFVFSNWSLTEVFWTWSPDEVFWTWSSTEYFWTWSSPTTAFGSLGQTPITWDWLEDFNEGVGD